MPSPAFRDACYMHRPTSSTRVMPRPSHQRGSLLLPSTYAARVSVADVDGEECEKPRGPLPGPRNVRWKHSPIVISQVTVIAVLWSGLLYGVSIPSS